MMWSNAMERFLHSPPAGHHVLPFTFPAPLPQGDQAPLPEMLELHTLADRHLARGAADELWSICKSQRLSG